MAKKRPLLVLAPRYVGLERNRFIEDKLETWLGLEINREKTRVVNLKEKGASLDFLGFTQYLNVTPSAKALKKEREKVREVTAILGQRGKGNRTVIPVLLPDSRKGQRDQPTE